MLVRQQTFHAAQEKIQRLERELEQARVSLARYKDQERELVEAVVAARVEAREVRSRAEIEASSVLGGARDEAAKINAEARAQLAAAQAEIARLRNVQHELSNSLDESLTALKGVLPSAASPLPDREAAPRVAGPPAPEILGVFSTTARLSTTTDARQDGQAGGAPVFSAAGHEASPSRRMPVDRAVAQRDGPPRLGPSGSRDVLAFWTSRKTLLRVAGAALALVCLALAAGGARWWRGSATDADAMANEPGVVHSDVKNSPNATAKRATKAEGATKLHSGASAGPASSHVRVALRAVRPVWLRVEVDGKQTTARLMRAGEELNLQGARNVTVRSGDAGALLIAINGAAHTTFGRDGTALTRRVTIGHLPSTPAAAPRPLAAAATPGAPASSQLPSIALASKSPILRPPLHASPVEPKPPVEPVAPLNGAKPPMLAQSAAGARPAPVGSPRSSAAPSEGSSEEGEVLRSHEAYFEALKRGDSGQMNRLLADGFSASGAPAADESGLPFEISLRNASVEVRGVGAVVSGTASQRISGPDGQTLRSQALLFSEVWVKRDGGWQLMNVRFVSAGPAR